MKSNILIAFTLFATIATGTFAQSKLSPAAQVFIHKTTTDNASRNTGEIRANAIVKLAPGTTAEQLALTPGVNIIAVRGNLAIINIPVDKAGDIAQDKAITAMDMGSKVTPYIDLARTASGAQGVIFGEKNGFTQNYRGTGIIVGMMDTGLDPNHINFYNKDATANRIQRLTTITGTGSTATTYDTPEKILSFRTDNASSSHATHVGGIMAGGYNSTLKSGIVTEDNRAEITTYKSSPYFGIASDAEIYPCVGDLYTANLTAAAELVAKYAKEQGKPAAFNLSVGITTGPHDGTTLFNQMLDKIGEDIIICIAAGNDGNSNVSIRKKFTSSADPLRTMITLKDNKKWSGTVDAWTSNSKTVKAQFAIINKNSGTVVWACNIPESTGEGVVYIANSKSTVNGKTSNLNFDESFSDDSNVRFSANINSENNRYEVYADFDVTPMSVSQVNVPAIIYTGSDGVQLDVYSFGAELTDKAPEMSTATPGFTAGNPDNSINDLACGKNVITVGAYKTRNIWCTLGGTALWYGENASPVDQVCDFTSYGTLIDGRKLPEICAPGEGIISSYSKYDYDANKSSVENWIVANAEETTANVSKDSRSNYFGIMQGTSQATPYITGSVALLLQANQALTVAEIKKALTETTEKIDGNAKQTMQWGAGKAKVDQALRKLLGMTTDIGNILNDTDKRLSLDIAPGAINIIVAGEKALSATLHTIGGVKAASASAKSDELTIDTSSLQQGVYVLNIETGSAERITRKVVIQ